MFSEKHSRFNPLSANPTDCPLKGNQKNDKKITNFLVKNAKKK